MTATLPGRARELLDSTNPVVLTTLNADGSAQSTPVWVLRDGDEILLSTLASRRKARNIDRDPRVSLVVLDLRDPSSYAAISGTVVSVTPDEGRVLLQRLSRKYLDASYPRAEGPRSVRVVIRVAPEHVTVR